jgi:hypothetical protein
MTDRERDARVSGAYRGLGRDEPPAQLDAAILAAAARRRMRWAVPVSVAAVVVLAVGVTLRVQMEERKGAEDVALSPQVMEAPPATADRAVPESRSAAPAAAPAPARPAAKREMQAMEAPAAPPAAALARDRAGVAVGKISKSPETPEQWLERIAKLREAGQARAADESLAEFRKRYPDYRMSDAMRARVAPR